MKHRPIYFAAAFLLDDKETLYENTSIRLSSLPDALKTEIQNGKYIRTEKELYDFLENYSS